MAFLRFSRDKRGYEHFALVQPTTSRRGATRQRILYLYRTPPDVKVGREPFDEAVQRALEAQYPDISFDWKKILETPVPSADSERWRERRRAERAARRAASAEAAVDEADAEVAAVGDLDLPAPPMTSPGESHADSDGVANVASSASPGVEDVPAADGARRRRRRRRGRRGRPKVATSPATAPEPSGPTGGEGRAVNPGDEAGSGPSHEPVLAETSAETADE